MVFESLKVQDKIAFFIFCVYRDISNDRRGNLEVHPDKQKFYDFAFQIFDNEKIVKSINKYTGRQIRYFEFTNEKGNTYYNGNTSSVAYKAAMTYLEAAFNLDEIKKLHTSNQPSKSNSPSYKDPIGYRGVTLNTKQKITNEYQNEVKKAYELSRKTKNSNSGCSLILILSIIVIITLTYCFFSL